MGGKKTIALLVGQADEEYQSNFINGFLTEAHSIGYNVAVFSMLYKYQNTKEEDQGDFNIFSLVPYAYIDAIVVLCDTIQSPGSIETLIGEIKKNFKGPVLDVDGNFDFPTQNSKSSKSILALLKHLTISHGYKDIAFLNGRIEHPFSKDRLNDYRTGLEKLGIEYDDSKVYYGDFWYSSGETMVEKLLRKGGKLPEAILCANDCMAIGVCKAFEKRGINVPKDVAVVSYDCSDEGRRSPVPITSAYIQAGYSGTLAARNIFALLNGGELHQEEPEAEMFMGESCGCSNKQCHFVDIRRKNWDTEKSRIGFESPYNYMMDDLFEQEKLEDYINSVYSYLYQIGDYKNFYLCLNDDWLTPEKLKDNVIRHKGFADRMIAVIDANSDLSRPDKVGFGVMFDKNHLLPSDAWYDEEPVTYFFTPMYHHNKIFGYAALGYTDPTVSYDGIYRMWIKLVSRGLELIRRVECGNIIIEEVKEAAAEAIAGAVNPVSYEESELIEQVKNILDNNAFDYKFQPIVSARDGQIYAYEALMRSRGKKIEPLTIVKYAEMLGRLSDIERSTFVNVLDIFKKKKDAFEGKMIFINSIPGVKIDDATHLKISQELRQISGRVVVELTEKAELDDEELASIKAEYKADGVEMAVDDYGTGYSNVSNLLRYMPKYVKIDRALLSNIQDDMQKQHFVREIVEFSHENNIMALAEGVETKEELATVIKMGVDLIQGFYTARPSYEPVNEIDRSVVKEILRYRREKEDGVDQQIYTAGRTNRVSLMNLIKDGANTIRVGAAGSTHRDITIVGTPGLNTDIHVEIEDNYKGQISLDNVGFSNIKNRPSIEIGENCDVNLVLKGDNFIRGGGIQVPESSKLTFEGEGNLDIAVNGSNYYGVGHDISHHHGDLIFDLDGTISIDANGKIGAAIGSGLGGKIDIRRGKYELTHSGDEGVVIGSVEGKTDVSIDCCDMTISCSLSNCACVGSLRGSNKVFIHKSCFRCDTGGINAVVIGCVEKGYTDFKCEEADMHINVNGPKTTTVIGSLEGDTDVVINHAGLYVTEEGTEALVFGGKTGNTSVVLDHVNFKATVETSYDDITFAPKENITVLNGAWKLDMIKKENN